MAADADAGYAGGGIQLVSVTHGFKFEARTLAKHYPVNRASAFERMTNPHLTRLPAGSRNAQWKVDYTYQYRAAKASCANGVGKYVLASLLVVGGVVLVSTYFSRFQRFFIPRCSQ